VRLFTFLERKVFVNMMRHAQAMIGNSSAGVIEAPSLGLPVVNIGQRQRGREHADNIIFTGYDLNEIESAMRRVTHDETFRAQAARGLTPYGDGRAGRRIATILAETRINTRLLHKRFVMGKQYA
jgi:UDP-N-acetylglucosamine 2-epimerase